MTRLLIVIFLTLSILSTQKVNAMDRDADAIYKEALGHISVKHYANAFRCLEAALQKEKCHPKTLYTMGYLCEFATEEGNSVKALQTASSWYTAASTNVTDSGIAKAANDSIARIVAKLHKRMSTVNVAMNPLEEEVQKISEASKAGKLKSFLREEQAKEFEDDQKANEILKKVYAQQQQKAPHVIQNQNPKSSGSSSLNSGSSIQYKPAADESLRKRNVLASRVSIDDLDDSIQLKQSLYKAAVTIAKTPNTPEHMKKYHFDRSVELEREIIALEKQRAGITKPTAVFSSNSSSSSSPSAQGKPAASKAPAPAAAKTSAKK